MRVADAGPDPVIVIGGGVIGLSLAFELLRRGRAVTLLERERPGCGSTQAAGGMLAPISEADIVEPELITLGRDSVRRYREFVSDLERTGGADCGYRDEGTLWVAARRDDYRELEHLAETLQAKGLEARRLTHDEVREREPYLARGILGGYLVEQDHQVDPPRLVGALERAVTRLGGRIVTRAEVTAVVARHGRVVGVRGRGRGGQPFALECGKVALAAGAWSEDGIELPIAPLGVRPVKGQLLCLRGSELVRHVIRSPDVYIIPKAGGELRVGATMEEMGHDLRPTAGAAMDLLRHAWELLPGVYELELVEHLVGARPAVDDHLPLIGPSEVEGLYLALAHFRNGILLAPATAAYLAHAIVEGTVPREIEPFLPGRIEVAAVNPPEAARGEA